MIILAEHVVPFSFIAEYVVPIPFIVGMALIIGLAIRKLMQKKEVSK